MRGKLQDKTIAACFLETGNEIFQINKATLARQAFRQLDYILLKEADKQYPYLVLLRFCCVCLLVQQGLRPQ
jgi:hypothetical protein